MALVGFVPTNATFDNALTSPTADREWRVLIDRNNTGELNFTGDDFTGSLWNNEIRGGYRGSDDRGYHGSYQVRMRNSQGSFAEGDLADRLCALEVQLNSSGFFRIFTGFISEQGAQRDKRSLTEDSIIFQMNDPLRRDANRRKTDQATYVNYKIADPSSSGTSLFHQLAGFMGLQSGDLVVGDLSAYTKDYLPLDGRRTAWSELQQMSQQYLAKTYFRYDGKLLFDSRFAAGYTEPASEITLDENLIHSIRGQNSPITSNRVTTEFSQYESLTADQVIYKNTDDFNTDTLKNEISVSANAYFPGAAQGNLVRAHYKDPESGERYPIGISIQTPSIGRDGDGTDIEHDGAAAGDLVLVSFNGTDGATADLTNQNPDSSEIILRNNTGSALTITKFEIRGTPVRETGKFKVRDIDNTVTLDHKFVDKTIPGKYAVGETQAHQTTQWWVDWGKVQRREYDIETRFLPNVMPGTVVNFDFPGDQDATQLSLLVEGFSHSSRGPERLWRTRLQLREKEDFTVTGAPLVIVESSPAGGGDSAGKVGVAKFVTKTEDQQGYEDPVTSLGTKVPTQVTIDAAKSKGLFKANQIEWDKQANLTNLARYEIQVSDDWNGSTGTFYTPRLDGVDWKGATGGDLDWPVEWFLHPNVPFDQDQTLEPIGRSLYYRVRRVTKEPVVGTYSTPVQLTTSTIDSGDLAANSITANKLSSGVIETVVAQIKDSIVISELQGWTGFVGKQEIFTAGATADVDFSLSGTHFLFSDPFEDFYAWFDVSGQSTDPALDGRVGIEVDILRNQPATGVANALSLAIDADSRWTAATSGEVVTVTSVDQGFAADVADAAGASATEFTFQVTQQGSDQSNPSTGDVLTYLDRNEVRIQQYTGGAWETRLQMGGEVSFGVFNPYYRGQGYVALGVTGPNLYDGYTPPTTTYDPIPTGAKIYNADNVSTDQDATGDWAYINNLEYTGTTLFGTADNRAAFDGDAAGASSEVTGRDQFGWAAGSPAIVSSWMRVKESDGTVDGAADNAGPWFGDNAYADAIGWEVLATATDGGPDNLRWVPVVEKQAVRFTIDLGASGAAKIGRWYHLAVGYNSNSDHLAYAFNDWYGNLLANGTLDVSSTAWGSSTDPEAAIYFRDGGVSVAPHLDVDDVQFVVGAQANTLSATGLSRYLDHGQKIVEWGETTQRRYEYAPGGFYFTFNNESGARTNLADNKVSLTFEANTSYTGGNQLFSADSEEGATAGSLWRSATGTVSAPHWNGVAADHSWRNAASWMWGGWIRHTDGAGTQTSTITFVEQDNQSGDFVGLDMKGTGGATRPNSVGLFIGDGSNSKTLTTPTGTVSPIGSWYWVGAKWDTTASLIDWAVLSSTGQVLFQDQTAGPGGWTGSNGGSGATFNLYGDVYGRAAGGNWWRIQLDDMYYATGATEVDRWTFDEFLSHVGSTPVPWGGTVNTVVGEVQATASRIESGDVIIKAAEGQRVIIEPSLNLITNENGPIADGDRQIYLDGDEVSVQERVDDAWSTLVKLGGEDADGLLRGLIQSRGLRTSGAADLGDPLPDRDVMLFNFESSTVPLQDAYGTDLEGSSANETSVTSPAKFGSRALRINVTAAAGYVLLEQDALDKWSWGWDGGDPSDFTIGAWVRFASISGSSFIMYAADQRDTGANSVRVQRVGDELRIIVLPGSDSYTHSTTVAADTWYFLAFRFDGSSQIADLVVVPEGGVADTDRHTMTVTWNTTGSQTALEVGFGSTSSGTYDTYFDDAFVYLDGLLALADLENHGERNAPWAPVAATDLSLNVGTGAAIGTPGSDLGGELAAVSHLALPVEAGGHALGAPRWLDEGDRGGSSWQLTSGNAITFTTVNFSAWVPYGVRALVLMCLGSGNSNNLIYGRREGSTQVAGTATVIFDQSGNSTGYQLVQVLCDSLGRMQYQNGSSSTNTSLQIRGYM